MIYAVIDTNVFVSVMITHNSNSATVRVFEHLMERKIVPLYNEEILSEYIEVLSRPHFKVPEEKLQILISDIRRIGIDSERIPFDAIMPDEDDRVFYEVALSKDDAYLVTGNQKHFPKTPIVVTPAEMLEILSRES